MSLAMLKKITDLEIKPLQLANRQIKYLYVVFEDVLVKLDKFIFLVDFVVMDVEEDKEAPLIFDRPFMKNTRIIIDVDEEKLKVKTQDDKLTFNVSDGLKHSNGRKDCLQIDASKKVFPETKEQLDLSNVLEKVIHHCNSKANEKKKELVPEYIEKATQ